MFGNYLEYLYKSAEKNKEKNIKIALSSAKKNSIFLDVGCADGKKTLWWAKAVGAKKIIGLEIEKKAGSLAKKKGIETHVINIDQEKWPIKSNSVDCVLSNLVIEHLTNIDHFISESFRVLKKGGVTIVSTNNLSSWHNIFSLIFGWAPFDLTNSSTKLWSIGNPLVVHKNEKPFYGKAYCHKCIYTTKWLKEWYNLYGFSFLNEYGSGYYPLPSFLGNLDKTHSAFITLVFKK